MKKDKKKTIKEDWLNKTLHSSDSKTLRTTHAILKWLSTGGNWPPRPPRHYHLRVKVINPSAASGHTRADNLSHQLPNVTGEFPSTEHILEKSRRRNKKGSRRWNWSNGGVKNGHSCAINLSRTTVKWGQTWRELIYDRAWMSQPIIVEDPKLFSVESVFSPRFGLQTLQWNGLASYIHILKYQRLIRREIGGEVRVRDRAVVSDFILRSSAQVHWYFDWQHFFVFKNHLAYFRTYYSFLQTVERLFDG